MKRSRQTSWTALPIDLVARVFQFLDLRDWFSGTMVCRHFSTACARRWAKCTTMCLENGPVVDGRKRPDTKHLTLELIHLDRLQDYHFECMTSLETLVLPATVSAGLFQHARGLKTLELGTSAPHMVFTHQKLEPDWWPDLERFCLTSSRHIIGIRKFIAAHPHLTDIRIKINHTNTVDELARACQGLRKLSVLRVQDVRPEIEDVAPSTWASLPTSLTILQLGKKCVAGGIDASAMSRLVQLRELNLDLRSVSNETLEAILNLQHLCRLTIAPDPAQVQQQCLLLSKCKHLRRLWLYGMPVIKNQQHNRWQIHNVHQHFAHLVEFTFYELNPWSLPGPTQYQWCCLRCFPVDIDKTKPRQSKMVKHRSCRFPYPLDRHEMTFPTLTPPPSMACPSDWLRSEWTSSNIVTWIDL